jgi:multiple sugar transport system permease protein
MTFLALIFALPIIYLLVSSLKPGWQILQDTSSIRAFLPVGDLSFANYVRAFRQAPVAHFLFNSVLITTLTVTCGLFVNSVAGFALSRLKWKGQKFILSVVIATIIIPFEAVAIPLLLIVNNLPWINENGITLGWLNSYRVQIFPFIADAYLIYLFVQYFKRLPSELFELAHIEGANWFQIFLWIVIPLSGPVYATAAILRLLVMWNQYLWPTLVIQTDKYRPIMVGFGYFSGGGAGMAYLTIATIPILIIFFLFQRSFIKSISETSYRG